MALPQRSFEITSEHIPWEKPEPRQVRVGRPRIGTDERDERIGALSAKIRAAKPRSQSPAAEQKRVEFEQTDVEIKRLAEEILNLSGQTPAELLDARKGWVGLVRRIARRWDPHVEKLMIAWQEKRTRWNRLGEQIKIFRKK